MKYTSIMFAVLTGVLIAQEQYTASLIALFFTLVVLYSNGTESEGNDA